MWKKIKNILTLIRIDFDATKAEIVLSIRVFGFIKAELRIGLTQLFSEIGDTGTNHMYAHASARVLNKNIDRGGDNRWQLS